MVAAVEAGRDIVLTAAAVIKEIKVIATVFVM